MKNQLLTILLLCISCTLFAQESMVTKSMAQKVGYFFLKNQGSLYIVDFEAPNHIRNKTEEVKVLKDICNHLDYVENFIGTSFRRHGHVKAKQFFDEVFGFTRTEINTASKIAWEWELKKEKDEESKELREEQDLWDKWSKDGSPVINYNQLERKPIIVCQNINDLKDTLTNIRLAFYYYKFLPMTSNNPRIDENSITWTIPFDIQIDANHNITLRSDAEYKKVIFESLGLNLETPATYRFNKLGKSMEVPCKITIEIVMSATKINSEPRYVYCRNDKKEGWIIVDNSSVSDMYKKKSADKVILTDDEIQQLHYIIKHQDWDIKNKYYLGFHSYLIKAKLVGTKNEEEIELPNKVAFVSSQVKYW